MAPKSREIPGISEEKKKKGKCVFSCRVTGAAFPPSCEQMLMLCLPGCHSVPLLLTAFPGCFYSPFYFPFHSPQPSAHPWEGPWAPRMPQLLSVSPTRRTPPNLTAVPFYPLCTNILCLCVGADVWPVLYFFLLLDTLISVLEANPSSPVWVLLYQFVPCWEGRELPFLPWLCSHLILSGLLALLAVWGEVKCTKQVGIALFPCPLLAEKEAEQGGNFHPDWVRLFWKTVSLSWGGKIEKDPFFSPWSVSEIAEVSELNY